MEHRSILSCDPGEHTGLVLWLDGSPVTWWAIRLASREGACRLSEVVSRAVTEQGATLLVIEQQVPFRGRSFAAGWGTAAFRGAVEHEARRVGLVGDRIVRIQPTEWQPAILRHLRAKMADKDAVFESYARAILQQAGVSPPVPWSDDVGDALFLGHYHLNRGLYV